jgi:O-antigen/teichoic acid export membrane protein
MNYVAPAQAVKSAAFAIGVLVAVRDGADLLPVGALEVLAATAGALYFVAAQRAVSIRPSLDLRWSRLWPLMRSGAVVGASNVVWPFIVYAPIFLVTNLAGAAQAAWLGSVQRIVVALVSFSALYFFNLYPLMARALSHQRHHWPRLIESSFRLVAWSTIGGALAIMLTSDAIVRAAFGPRFAAAGAVMAIYVWVLPIRLLSGHARWALVAAERQGVLLLTESGCAFTLVLGGVALVPTYGATGAAVAAVVATAIGWAFAHVGARRVAGPMPAVGGALLPAAAALLSAAVAWGGSKDQAGRLVIAVVVYGGCMWFAARDICSDIKWLAHAKRLVADSPVAADA